MSVENYEDLLAERIIQALEEVEQLDELSPELLSRASQKAYRNFVASDKAREQRIAQGGKRGYTKAERKANNRASDLSMAAMDARRKGKSFDAEHRKADLAKYPRNESMEQSTSIEKIAEYISEQVRKERALGLHAVNESTGDHIMISHPHETLHAGDNKNRTGKALTDRNGDFSKEYHNQEHHYNQILKKIGKHKDAKVHDGHEDEAGHVSFKKGSAAHEAVKDHLQHVDHSAISHEQHKSGPNA